MNKSHNNNKYNRYKPYFEDGGELPKAQYGLGYRFSNPYNYSDIPVNAAASYLSMNETARGMQFREDGTQRYTDKQINNFSWLSAGLGALDSFANAYGQRQDNKREIERLQRIRDSEYYNVPTDRYAYNSQSQNARQNTFYQDGGYLNPIYNLNTLNNVMPVSTTQVVTKPVSLDYLNLHRANEINYNNVTQIESDRMKMLMGYPKGVVKQFINGLSDANYSNKKFRYREKEDGGYIDSDGYLTENNQNDQTNQNDFYGNPKEEVYQSNDFDKSNYSSFFLNSSTENQDEVDYSKYEPKFADEDENFLPHHNRPIMSVVEKLRSMGLTPSSIESGKHNEGSKHYNGKAVDLGINTTFRGDVKKMKEFKNWFNSEGKKHFPGVKLFDETVRPKGQKVWSGAHYHLEI